MKRLSFLLALCTPALADVTVTEKPDRVSIEINGQLFTEYRHGDAPHVYYWPVLGPGGVKMTRSYPMEKVEGEQNDHVHHRSMWFFSRAGERCGFLGRGCELQRHAEAPRGQD